MTVTKQCECCANKPRLGHYQLEKALGAGNYAVVRLAEHCITGTKVRVVSVVMMLLVLLW